ncbi:hypothetical protein BGZ94_001806 [Podila epigama]|nr:hypothetical protein BGZ94_001806 [Podila epigama]
MQHPPHPKNLHLQPATLHDKDNNKHNSSSCSDLPTHQGLNEESALKASSVEHFNQHNHPAQAVELPVITKQEDEVKGEDKDKEEFDDEDEGEDEEENAMALVDDWIASHDLTWPEGDYYMAKKTFIREGVAHLKRGRRYIFVEPVLGPASPYLYPKWVDPEDEDLGTDMEMDMEMEISMDADMETSTFVNSNVNDGQVVEEEEEVMDNRTEQGQPLIGFAESVQEEQDDRHREQNQHQEQQQQQQQQQPLYDHVTDLAYDFVHATITDPSVPLSNLHGSPVEAAAGIALVTNETEHAELNKQSRDNDDDGLTDKSDTNNCVHDCDRENSQEDDRAQELLEAKGVASAVAFPAGEKEETSPTSSLLESEEGARDVPPAHPSLSVSIDCVNNTKVDDELSTPLAPSSGNPPSVQTATPTTTTTTTLNNSSDNALHSNISNITNTSQTNLPTAPVLSTLPTNPNSVDSSNSSPSISLFASATDEADSYSPERQQQQQQEEEKQHLLQQEEQQQDEQQFLDTHLEPYSPLLDTSTDGQDQFEYGLYELQYIPKIQYLLPQEFLPTRQSFIVHLDEDRPTLASPVPANSRKSECRCQLMMRKVLMHRDLLQVWPAVPPVRTAAERQQEAEEEARMKEIKEKVQLQTQQWRKALLTQTVACG